MANINEFQEQLDILKETKTQIKQSIINKGKEVSDVDSFRSYANKIDGIVTLEEGTSDANAIADDIARDKVAYVNGEKVIGSVFTINEGTATGETEAVQELDNYIKVDSVNMPYSTLLRKDVQYSLEISKPTLSDAIGLTSDRILTGNTVLGLEGTATSDATATTNDIVEGKSAYVNGVKVEGNIVNNGTWDNIFENDDIKISISEMTNQETMEKNIKSLRIQNSNLNNDSRKYLYTDVIYNIPASKVASLIGLTADKIKKGETILGITGTFEATTEVQEQINTLTQENATLTETINENNVIAEDILGTNS